MRYVDAIASSRSLQDLQRVHKRLTDAQAAGSSGLKHGKASDDPAWYDTHTRTSASLQRNATFKQNLASAQGRLERSDGALEQATGLVTRLQELSVQVANGTYSAADRAAAGIEVQSLKSQMLALANSKDQDGYLFGGYTSNTAPYDAAGNFVGDGSDRTTVASVSASVYASVSGPAAFDFSVFDQIATAMNANDPAAIHAGLANIDNALTTVTHARTIVGDRLKVIETQNTRLDNEDTATSNDRARLVETDPIAAYTEIAKQSNALEAAMKISAKALHASLFDML